MKELPEADKRAVKEKFRELVGKTEEKLVGASQEHPQHVKGFLGHKSIKNTEIYITVERAIFGDSCSDEFTVKVTSNPEEIKALLEVGFEYVC